MSVCQLPSISSDAAFSPPLNQAWPISYPLYPKSSGKSCLSNPTLAPRSKSYLLPPHVPDFTSGCPSMLFCSTIKLPSSASTSPCRLAFTYASSPSAPLSRTIVLPSGAKMLPVRSPVTSPTMSPLISPLRLMLVAVITPPTTLP